VRRHRRRLERGALKALALEEYKLGRLTTPQLRGLLGFGAGDALDGFLKARDLIKTQWTDSSGEGPQSGV
jgi:hypothetical protein